MGVGYIAKVSVNPKGTVDKSARTSIAFVNTSPVQIVEFCFLKKKTSFRIGIGHNSARTNRPQWTIISTTFIHKIGRLLSAKCVVSSPLTSCDDVHSIESNSMHVYTADNTVYHTNLGIFFVLRFMSSIA